ncbi:MAG TPA: chemotaxis protein CheD [Thermodesulfobacteriota bacterium]
MKREITNSPIAPIAGASGKTVTVHRVGMGEYRVDTAPNRLLAFGLGSCVGVFLYSREAAVGGLAHVMLPEGAHLRRGTTQPAKFADLALDLMLGELARLGADASRLSAKIFGGANMFPMIETIGRAPIGERNVAAVREALARAGIPIEADETGGEFGRTVEADLATGIATVKAWNRPTLKV